MKGWQCPRIALSTEISPSVTWQRCPSCHCHNAPSPFPFLTCFAFLSGASLTLTIQFIPVHHHNHLQKFAKCQKSRNVKTSTQRRGRKSMLLCQKSTCLFQKALCWILSLERSHGCVMISTQISDNSTAEAAQNQRRGTFSSSTSALGSGICWDHGRAPA